MESVLRDRMSMIAALGAGVVVGISGIYLYYKVNKCVTRELSHLTGTIESLRREIEELKAATTKKAKDRRMSPDRRKYVNHLGATSSKFFTGYTSSIEDPDEEYFDFTDHDEVNVNGVWSQDFNVSDCFAILDSELDDDTSDKEAVYEMISRKKDGNMDNAEYLWRLAKATHLYGIAAQNMGVADKKKKLAFEAAGYARAAYNIDKNNAEVLKWSAITVGSIGEYVGAEERITNGYTFKEHLDEAIKLKPEDPTLHYMLGRWCYEVASLSWLERKFAATLFSSPPEATLEEARAHLELADTLKPMWKENLLYIAKTYIGEGDYSKAISIIDNACELPVTREDDAIAQKELEALQYKYQTYRV